jgi:hypothetical protein
MKNLVIVILLLFLAPQPSLGLGLLLKITEFLGGFSTFFFFTG